MQRYFMKEDYQEKDLYKVADENYHHIVRVMRMTPNDRCYLVFQNKTAILAEIVEIDSTSVYFKEISKEEMDKELPIEVTIACGLPKGDKLEWIVQKGTELGGNQFIGFPAKTSVVKWDHKKEQPKKKDYKKLPQKRRSNRIGSRHQVFLWWKKHKKSLRNLTHMTQSWLRMKNQQNKEKKVN